MPIVVVWWLRQEAIVSSPWLLVAIAIALSLAASMGGSAVWKRCRGSGDVFFSELLLWGWWHRFRGERRLAKTVGLLGLGDARAPISPLAASVERKSELLRDMAAALDAQDPYTDGHSRRVALHSAMVGRKLGLSREDIVRIRTAAAIHDIGKLRIPVELLNKPSELSPEEFEIVKRHAVEGAEIVSCMQDPEITGMVRHHHERFDGAGYPSSLAGEETPLGARIIAVADTFDALTSERPYRKAISHKRALDAIEAASGTQLDPVVVRAFLRCYSANRAVLFWTLLIVSPQRALAWVRGKSPGHGGLSAGAAVAVPAALATVVAATLGPVTGVAPARQPLRLAQHPVLQTAAAPIPARHRPPAKAANKLSPPSPGATAPRHAVLGVARSLPTGQPRVSSHLQRVGGGGTSASGGSGGGSTPPASHPGGGAGGGKPAPRPINGASPKHPPTPGGLTTSPVTPPAKGSGAPPANGPTTSGSPAGPPASTPPSPGPGGSGSGGAGGSGGGGSGNGSGGGGGSGSGGGGSGGNGGGGGGQGSGGSGTPTTKDECKNGGYSNYGFSNQGECVASVEHGAHP